MERDVFSYRWPLLRHPVAIAFYVLVIAGVLCGVIYAVDALMVGFLGVLMAFLMSYPVGWFTRIMPRGLAVILTLVAMGGVLAGIGFLAAPTVTSQVEQIATDIPQDLQKLRAWYFRTQQSGPLKPFTQGGPPVEKRVEAGAEKVLSGFFSKTLPATVSVFSVIILIVVLGAFLVHQPELYRRGLLNLVPREHEAVFNELLDRIAVGMRHWVGGIVLAMAIMGAFCATGLAIAGINDWFILGILTFFGTFIPYAGAIASAVPGLIIALAQSPTHFLYAGIVYLGVHLVEGYIVQPYIMKHAVEIRPALQLFGQLLMGTLLALPGVIIATPFIVCVQITVEYLYIERKLGKVTGEEAGRGPVPVQRKAG